MTDRPTDAEVEAARWWVRERSLVSTTGRVAFVLGAWRKNAGRGLLWRERMDTRARAILAAAGEANDDD